MQVRNDTVFKCSPVPTEMFHIFTQVSDIGEDKRFIYLPELNARMISNKYSTRRVYRNMLSSTSGYRVRKKE